MRATNHKTNVRAPLARVCSFLAVCCSLLKSHKSHMCVMPHISFNRLQQTAMSVAACCSLLKSHMCVMPHMSFNRLQQTAMSVAAC